MTLQVIWLKHGLRLDLLAQLIRHSDKAMRTTAFILAGDIEDSPLGVDYRALKVC